MPRIRWTQGPDAPLPEEFPTTLYVNGRELVTVQATREALRDWAFGFLFSEGFIRAPDDVLALAMHQDRGRVWVRIAGSPAAETMAGRRRYLTSGCGRGVTFSSPEAALGLRPVVAELRVHHHQLAHYQLDMHRAAVRYRASGGMHVAAVFRAQDGAMLAREDISRHNAVDKAIGAALLAGWAAAGLVLMTSGRISYEMCLKAARFGVPVVVSRSAATDQAVRMGRRLGVELIGYLRQHGMRVYTSGQRVADAVPIPHSPSAINVWGVMQGVGDQA